MSGSSVSVETDFVTGMQNLSGIGGVSGPISLWGDFGVFEGMPKEMEKIQFQEGCIKVADPSYLAECRFEQCDDVWVREDTFCNTSNRLLSLYRYLMRFSFTGGDFSVYTQNSGWQNESQGQWQPLVTKIEAKNRGLLTCGGATPMVALWNNQTNKGVVFHLFPGGQWKISVSKEVIGGGMQYTVVELGLSDSHLRMEVSPGETVKMPKVLFYPFDNKTDLDCYKLHRYCNRYLPRRELPVMYNTWFLDFYRVSFKRVVSQIKTASYMGIDYFVLDAGWFGQGEAWSDCIGYWEENTTSAYEGRMKDISRLVKEHGMKFGLWLEPERALKNAPGVKEHPEYYLSNGHSYFLDFGNPVAVEYITKITFDLIDRYQVDFLKFDLNDGLYIDSYHSAFTRFQKGYDGFLESIRKRYPSIYIENCAGGGSRMELGQLKLFDSFWTSDNQSVYDGLRIYKDTLLRLPPVCMEKWVAVQWVDHVHANYFTADTRRMIASNNATWDDVTGVYEEYLFAYLTGGLTGFTCDINAFPEDFKDKCKAFIEKMKKDQVFWMNCEVRILMDNEDVLVLQYGNRYLSDVRICLYTKSITQNEITVIPVVDKNAIYNYEGSIHTGQKLSQEGIKVRITRKRDGMVFSLKKVQ